MCGLQLNRVVYRDGCEGGSMCVGVESWKLIIGVEGIEMVLSLLIFESVL